jgi:putative DNA primase/helicase
VRVFDLPDSLPPGSDVSDYYNVLDRNDETFREAISNLEQLADSSSKPEQDPPLTHKDRSDSDNATRFVDLHGDCLHFVPKWKKWIIFLEDRQTWLEDDADVQVRELAKAVGEKLKRDAVTVKAFSHAIRSLSKNGITAMVDLARGVEGIPLDHEDLDSDGSTLGVENGVVDLKTGKLRGADPADLMTKQCPVRFDEDAHCPRFEQAMEEWFPDEEVRRYVQRVAGSALVGFQKDHVFIIHYGGGRNGKGTFTRALQHALGPYARVIHLSLLVHSKGSQHDTIKADLFRARLAVASELKSRIPLDEASVKNLTGGDRITARRMHQDPWEFDPSHSLWLQTNYLPQITGRDRGIWSRIKVVRWEATFEGKKDDQNLDEKLREEAPGILNWLIAGCLEWQEHGLKEPKAVVRETLAYRQAEDVLNVFLSEAGLAFDSSLEIKARELQELLADWSKEEGRPAPTRDVKGWLLENGVTQIQRREDGKRPRYWLGIGVKDPKGDTDETA